jgi:hypothetical protein
MITAIEKESVSNQLKVKETMAGLRKIISDQEKILLENIQNIEKNQKKSVEIEDIENKQKKSIEIQEYKCQLQGQQQVLIEEVFTFVDPKKDKKTKKRKEAKTKYDNYKQGAVNELLKLTPSTSPAKYNYKQVLDELEKIGGQIKNIKVEQLPQYANPQLQQRITQNGNNTTLNLSSSNLTDDDMEIVAEQIRLNEVKEHCFFLTFRLFRSLKSKVFLRAT